MKEQNLFKIAALIISILLLVLMFNLFLYLKQNPCADASCQELYRAISEKRCFLYSEPELTHLAHYSESGLTYYSESCYNQPKHPIGSQGAYIQQIPAGCGSPKDDYYRICYNNICRTTQYPTIEIIKLKHDFFNSLPEGNLQKRIYETFEKRLNEMILKFTESLSESEADNG